MAKKSDKIRPQGQKQSARPDSDPFADILSSVDSRLQGATLHGLAIPSVPADQKAPVSTPEDASWQDVDPNLRAKAIEVNAYTARFVACVSRGRHQHAASIAESRSNPRALFSLLEEVSDVVATQNELRDQIGDYLCSLARERWDRTELFMGDHSHKREIGDAPSLSEFVSTHEFNQIFPLPDTVLPGIRGLAQRVAQITAHHPVLQERLRNASLPNADLTTGQNLVQCLLAVHAIFNALAEAKLLSALADDQRAPELFSNLNQDVTGVLFVKGTTVNMLRAFKTYWASHFIQELACQLQSPSFFDDLSSGLAQARFVEHYFKRADWKNFDGLRARLRKHEESLESLREAAVFLRNQEGRREFFKRAASSVEGFAANNPVDSTEGSQPGPAMNLLASRAHGQQLHQYLVVWDGSGDARLGIQEIPLSTAPASDVVKMSFLICPGGPSEIYSLDINPKFKLGVEESALWLGQSGDNGCNDPLPVVRGLHRELERMRVRISRVFPHVVSRLGELEGATILFLADDDGIAIAFPSGRLEQMADLTGLRLVMVSQESQGEASSRVEQGADDRLCVLSLPWEQTDDASTAAEDLAHELDLELVREGDIFALRQCKKLLRECAFTRAGFINFLRKHWPVTSEAGTGSHVKLFFEGRHFSFGKDMRAPTEPLEVPVAARSIQRLQIPLNEIIEELKRRL